MEAVGDSALTALHPMFPFRPGLQEVVTDDDGFETEIIEFRNAVGTHPLFVETVWRKISRKKILKSCKVSGGLFLLILSRISKGRT